MITLRKKINLILMFLNLFLFGFYIYQTISITSGNVTLITFKKEFFEIKNGLTAVGQNDFNPAFVKENLGMAEIEKFDYLILGLSEFALIKEDESVNQQ